MHSAAGTAASRRRRAAVVLGDLTAVNSCHRIKPGSDLHFVQVIVTPVRTEIGLGIWLAVYRIVMTAYDR